MASVYPVMFTTQLIGQKYSDIQYKTEACNQHTVSSDSLLQGPERAITPKQDTKWPSTTLAIKQEKQNCILTWLTSSNPKGTFLYHTFLFLTPSAGGRECRHQVLYWSIAASLTHSFPPSLHTFLPHLLISSLFRLPPPLQLLHFLTAGVTVTLT